MNFKNKFLLLVLNQSKFTHLLKQNFRILKNFQIFFILFRIVYFQIPNKLKNKVFN